MIFPPFQTLVDHFNFRWRLQKAVALDRLGQMQFAFFDEEIRISTTVSLTSIRRAAAGASIELSDDDVAGEQVAQGRDGIGHVALRALGARAGCNPRVG